MMRCLLYICACIILLVSCQQEQVTPTSGEAVLELALLLNSRPQMEVTRAIDEDLAIDILDADNAPYRHYNAGAVPKKIVLEPGSFKVIAYTENQEDWKTANEGKGEACYYAEAPIEMELDKTVYLTLNVPMTNYAVGLQLPDLWETLFNAYTFRLKSGGRTVVIRQGERAYFDLADGGFSYALSATNTDGRTSSHSAISYTEVEAGKLYTLSYHYDSDANSGGIDIVIDDMTIDNNPINP